VVGGIGCSVRMSENWRGPGPPAPFSIRSIILYLLINILLVNGIFAEKNKMCKFFLKYLILSSREVSSGLNLKG